MREYEKLEERIAEQLGDGYIVTFHKITKNNGTEQLGFTIRKDDEKCCPTIYFDAD